MNIEQFQQQFVPVDRLARPQRDHHFQIVLRRTEPINAGDAGDDDHIPPTDQRRRRREPQPIDLFVDRRVFLYVDVARRDVRLRLVVVVIADEVRYRVVWKELFELGIKLRGQRLVVRQHQRRAIQLGDDIRHREGLAGAGDSQQHLIAFAVFNPS